MKTPKTYHFNFAQGQFSLTEAGTLLTDNGEEPLYRITAFSAQGQRYTPSQRPLDLFTAEANG